MKHYLIAGAGGFLGTELIKQLAGKDNIQVIALTAQSGKLKKEAANAENIEIVERKTIFSPDFIFSDIDVLINCAFPRKADGIQMAEGLLYISTLLEKAVTGGARAVINISSQSVYSQKRISSATEDAELNLETGYAVGKYATELMTNSICRKISHTNIRMASLVGPGFDQRLINKFVKQVLSGNDIHIKGGKQLFGFLDVRDAASAIITAADCADWDEVYNLGPERSYSLLELAEYVQETISESGIAKTGIKVEETGEWQNSDLDSKKFRRQFGWKARYDLKSTINRIIEVTG